MDIRPPATDPRFCFGRGPDGKGCPNRVLADDGSLVAGTERHRAMGRADFLLCASCHAGLDVVKNPKTGAVVGSRAAQRQAAEATAKQIQFEFGPLANLVASIRQQVSAGADAEMVAPHVRGLLADPRAEKAIALSGKQGRAAVDAVLKDAPDAYRAQVAALLA